MRMISLLILVAILATTTRAGLSGRGEVSTPDVVGTYSYSHPYGAITITLSKDGSYVSSGHDCTTTYNYKGSYAVKDGVVETKLESATRGRPGDPDFQTLFPEKDAAAGGGSGKGGISRYRPVRWGERLYLLGEEEMLNFCNAVNLGAEPRKNWQQDGAYFMAYNDVYFGSFLLRDGDEKKGVADVPQLPESWQEYVLKKPVKGVVLSIDGGGRATISVGSAQGLKAGMALAVRGGPAPSMWSGLRVVSVGDTTSVVEGAEQVVEGSKVSSRYEPPKDE